MPVNPVVPDIWEVRAFFTLADGEEAVNVYAVDSTVLLALDDTTSAAVAACFVDAWSDHLQAFSHPTCSFDKLVITDLDVVDGDQVVVPVALSGTEAVGNPLPNQIAGLVSWYTGTRGPSGRGRTYLGGFTETGSEGNGMTNLLHDAVADWAAMLNGSLQTALARQRIVSRYENNPTPPPSSIPRATNESHNVQSWLVHDEWKTQRRRALR